MEIFDRSNFRMSGGELDIHEALIALDRLLENPGVAESTRGILERAARALRDPASTD
jgi:hypothetical protein